MAIRTKRESKIKNGFKYALHIDGGGPISSREFVSIRPVDESEDWSIVRWFYFDEQTVYYERNFAEKVCTNEEYRKKCINETADWAIISNIFEPVEKELYDSAFQNGTLDKAEVKNIIEEAFEYINTEVRENNNTSLKPVDVFSYLSTNLVSKNI